MKAIATFETTVQVSEDQWSLVRHAVEIDENTTIGEIQEWAKTKTGTHAVRGEIRFSVLPLDSIPHVKKETDCGWIKYDKETFSPVGGLNFRIRTRDESEIDVIAQSDGDFYWDMKPQFIEPDYVTHYKKRPEDL